MSLRRALSALAVLCAACGARDVARDATHGIVPAGPQPDPLGSQSGDCRGDCFYVDARSGRDQNDGRSVSAPFATLQRAARDVRPGSTVIVMDGEYTSDGSAPPLTITASGTADAWISFRAAPGHHPVIRIPRGPGAWAGIRVQGGSYVAIEGFEIVGQNHSIDAAEAARNDGSQPFLNEWCIAVDGWTGAAVPHDIVIRNNSLHDCSAAGILAIAADALTIASNRVYDNSWWSVLSGSGIELYHLTDVPGSGSAASGYKNVISGNVVYGNDNRVPFLFGQPPAIYDGNGIIVDDSDHRQAAIGAADVRGKPYSGRTLIVNNIVNSNGGRGIHVYSSSHVDVVNNTAWNDLQNGSTHVWAEIDAQDSSDVNVVNNVVVNRSWKQLNANDGGTYAYNVWYGLNVPNIRGDHDVFTDPLLANPAQGDFTPLPGSPALGSGTSALAPPVDFFGNPRPPGRIDRGAIQVTR